MRPPALIAALLFPVLLHAQFTVKGIVADSGTRSPLPFATVQTADKSKAVIAAINGRFVISANEEAVFNFRTAATGRKPFGPLR